jgi:L-lactate utilization protein LutB
MKVPPELASPENDSTARTLGALKKNGFLAYFFPKADEAKQLVLDSVEQGMRVGLAGSATVRQMGLVEGLKAKGALLLDHWDESLTFEDTLRVRKEQLVCDVLLSSVNAITEEGELVSRDGIGNRTSAMTFGPAKVFLLVGTQKIVPDLRAAIGRIDEVAAPMRAKSLNMDLPCTEADTCVDCDDPSRICRATLILHRRPMLTDITVVLIGEALGT